MDKEKEWRHEMSHKEKTDWLRVEHAKLIARAEKGKKSDMDKKNSEETNA